MGPNALKDQRCELIFFWCFSLRQKIIWTGTTPFSAPSIVLEGDTETGDDLRMENQTIIGCKHTLGGVLVYMSSDGLATDDVLFIH